MRGCRNICMCATAFRIADLRGIPPQPADRFLGDMYYWVRLLAGGGEVGCAGQYLSHYHFYRRSVTNETGRMNIEQWYAESDELAGIMSAAILADPGHAGEESAVRATAAQFVAMSTILQMVWNALRNVPRADLLGACSVWRHACVRGWRARSISASTARRPLFCPARCWSRHCCGMCGE